MGVVGVVVEWVEGDVFVGVVEFEGWVWEVVSWSWLEVCWRVREV